MEPGEILKGPRKVVEMCMPLQGSDSLKSRVNSCIGLGYNVIVLDTYAASTQIQAKTKQKLLTVPEAPEIPASIKSLEIPVELIEMTNDVIEYSDIPSKKKRKLQQAPKSETEKFLSSKVTILKRLTVELVVMDDQHKLRRNNHNKNILEYDIIAVLPRSIELLHAACTALDVDVITLDPGADDKYLRFGRGSIAAAKKRGIMFEIKYGNLLKNNNWKSRLPRLFNCVHNLISGTAHCGNLKSVTPNVILSSGGKEVLDFRSEKDLEHFLDLFDIEQGKTGIVVRNNPLKVLLHAFQRKTAKSAIYIEKVDAPVVIGVGDSEKVQEQIMTDAPEGLPVDIQA